MKVLIVGATGRVAGYVIRNLTDAGHFVYAAARKPDSFQIDRSSVEVVPFDLHWSKARMMETVKRADAVYFLAGSRGKDLLQTDAFGAVQLMQAAEEAGVKRFIILSSIFAMEPDKWSQEESLKNITNYNIAKFFADEWLVHNTDLDYTIIQPSVLKETEGTGRIEINPEHDGSNPIPDVARVLSDVLEMKNTYKKVIKMRTGDTEIASALKAV
ncbi:MAG: NAD(P)H-binding protein [Eubacterium sp.]|nr:NAD(P)H-binding protein [Eubacterium sp.]